MVWTLQKQKILRGGKNTQKNCTKKTFMTQITTMVWSLTRHPGMRSQVALRNHHYKQSYWRWWNSSWAISNLKRWCCESVAFNMLANLENSAMATGLEKASFHSSSKERQCQNCSNYHTISLISHASKVMLKILQARLQSTWTKKFQMYKLDL